MRGGIREEGLHPGVRALPGAVRGPFNRSGRAPIVIFRRAPASSLVAPVSGPLAMVEASQHHDFVLLDDEEEGVGASFRAEAQSHSISLREALGRSGFGSRGRPVRFPNQESAALPPDTERAQSSSGSGHESLVGGRKLRVPDTTHSPFGRVRSYPAPDYGHQVEVPQPRGLTRPRERFALLAFEAGPSPGAPQDAAPPPPEA